MKKLYAILKWGFSLLAFFVTAQEIGAINIFHKVAEGLGMDLVIMSIIFRIFEKIEELKN